MRCFRYASSLLAVCVLALVACEKEQQPETKIDTDAGVDKNATLDPALAKAVAAASAGARGPAAAYSGGPPPNGIFPPGAADKEIKRGDAPKVSLGGQGAEPRVLLGPAQPKPGLKLTGTVELMQRDTGGGGYPIEFTLRIEAKKSDKASGTDAGAAPSPVAMVAHVVGARVAVAGVPREADEAFGKLKGAKVEYDVLPDGSGTGYRYDVGGAKPELADMMGLLKDTIALVTLPLPSQPVGKGAFWMVTTREGVLGLDLVTYRMVKLEELSGDKATLSVSAKRYATSNRFELAQLPADVPKDLAGFEAKSEGRLEFSVGTPFPLAGQVASGLAAQLGSDPQKGGTLQLQSRAGLSFQPAK